MEGPVKNIILTAAYLEDGTPDYENLTTDVIVQFDNDVRYIATFMSSKSLMDAIGELSGAPEGLAAYRVLNAVLIKDFNHGDLLPVIEALLSEGDFQMVFKRM